MSRLTRDDIVIAAGRRFATYGYHGTSMRDLGDDLGILPWLLGAGAPGPNQQRVADLDDGWIREPGDGVPAPKAGGIS